MPNHLEHETSPYLLQHKDNPVEWYPWGEEALGRAAAEDKPILVSIGYASCHWCHVMAHESFENPAIADQMNRDFINIKVDREERPDLDNIYMAAVTALSGHGGWPLNVFLTPDGAPFFGGTYWPPADRAGMPGFPKVLDTIARAYHENRDGVNQNAETLRGYLQQAASEGPPAGDLTAGLVDDAAATLLREMDPEQGGFRGAPKFPQTPVLDFLLRYQQHSTDASYAMMVKTTLGAMAAGGIYDQLGGGFARYSVDAEWLVPHFEKMLYDNAQLARLYVDAWRAFGDDAWRTVAEETCDYVLRDMTGPEGQFYSAQDADSEGVEGKYYVWTTAEIDAVLPANEADLVKLHLGVTPGGNFEGTTILSVVRTPEELAEATGQPEDEIAVTLARAKAALLKARQGRVPPATDDKAIAGWNGLMLGALAEAGSAFGRQDYIDAAVRNATFLLAELRPQGILRRSWRHGASPTHAFLEDYAFLADGLIRLYHATFDTRWLDSALMLTTELVRDFANPQRPAFFDTSDLHDELIARPVSLQDMATPCGNSAAAGVLLTLGRMTGKEEWTERAQAILSLMVEPMRAQPIGYGHFLAVTDTLLQPLQELVFAGKTSDPAFRKLTGVLYHTYTPAMIVGASDPGLPDLPARFPFLEYRPLVKGGPAAYLCEHFTCKPPVTTPDELRDLLTQEEELAWQEI